MTIKMPGYRAVLENEAFEKSEKRGRAHAKRFISICRYTQPTEDDVLPYVRSKAKLIYRIMNGDASLHVSRKLTELEEGLKGLPTRIVKEIMDGSPMAESMIRKLTPAPAAEAGGCDTYAYIISGFVPASCDPGWYKKLHSNEIAIGDVDGLFMMKLLITAGNLPPLQDVETMLQNGVKYAETMECHPRIAYSADDITPNVVRPIYSALSTREAVESLKDISGRILEEHSMKPVRAIREICECMANVPLGDLGDILAYTSRMGHEDKEIMEAMRRGRLEKC